MKPMLDFLANQGSTLLLGTTLLLFFALLLALVHQQPIHRQRIAESSMLLCVLFLILACIPLPRFDFKKKAPLPPKPLPLYTLQPGDELIAAEVFKVPNQKSTPTFNQPTILPISLPPAAAAPVMRNWPVIFASVYLSGLAACTFYTLLGHLLLHRLVLHSTAAQADLVESLPRSRIRVRICDCERPLSFGLFRPTILLPARFNHLDRTKQQHILLHELAHISQRDAFGHFLFNLLFPVLYFHPLYWLLRRKTNLARELIADDLAAAHSSRESYVADLLAIARDRLGRAALTTQALGLFQSRTDLYRRMHMLMQTNQPLARRCSIFWRLSYSTLIALVLVIASGTFGLRRASAQTNAAQQQAEVGKRNADEQATLAAQRQAELDKLRAEQDQIKALLDVLTQEKQQLQAELAKRKADGAQAQNLAARYKNAIVDRENALRGGPENTPATLDKTNPNEKAAADRDDATNAERAALRDWMNKRNPPARDPNEFPGRAQLDLVSLANCYVDAMGNVELAQVRLSLAQGKPDEIQLAKVSLMTAERKVKIFRGIAQAALQSAKGDLEFATQQFQNGIAPRNGVTEAQSRIVMLEVILAQ